MIRVDVRDAVGTVKRMKAQFGKDATAAAISRSLNHTMGKSRTKASAKIRSTYVVKAGTVKRKTVLLKAQKTKLKTTLKAPKAPLPMIDFRASPNKRGVSVTVKKGRRKVVRGAFIQKMPKGGRGVYARGKYANNKFDFRHNRLRKSGPDLPIDQLKSASLSSMYQDPELQAAVHRQATSDFQKRMEHEYKRMINKSR